VATTAAILTAIIVYLAGLLLLHAVAPDDVQKIPIAGKKLNQIMEKLHH